MPDRPWGESVGKSRRAGRAAIDRSVRTFYGLLLKELNDGNGHLDREEHRRLQGNYPAAMDPKRFPPELVATVYARRRFYPVQAILESEAPLVLDAGCGYGSDSFLFASLGARVLAVDVCAGHLAIARKRKRYYEEALHRPLEIVFASADLDGYAPESENLSLTWLSSVLAIVRNQDAFLDRVYRATRPGGKVMIVDFNLLNPIFFWAEWRRRRRALEKSPEFAGHADFYSMFRRRDRSGARFFQQNGDIPFDDVQFFTPATLARVLRSVGFRPLRPAFSGITPPFFAGYSAPLERFFSGLPGLKRLGRAYVVRAEKC